MSTAILNHSAHVTWDCTYHVVIVPKYRKKVLFEQVRKRAGEILRELAKQKEVMVVQGNACPDHIHLILSIPPKYSVAHVLGFLKGKSAIRLHYEFGRKKKFLSNKNFWTRGYFVRTVGIDRARAEEYVKKQLEGDRLEDENPQMELHWE
jgi:putative transposase